MKNRENLDSIDELFRAKLYDFEVETMPDDWEKIESRLSGRNIVPFYRKAIFRAVAAVAVLLLLIGSIFLLEQRPEIQQIAESIESIEQKEINPQKIENVYAAESSEHKKEVLKSTLVDTSSPVPVLAYVNIDDEDILMEPVEIEMTELKNVEEPVSSQSAFRSRSIQNQNEEQPARLNNSHKKTKRWQFGMGGGSVSAGSSNSMNTYAFRNTSFSDVDLLSSNALNTRNDEAAKTDIDHNVPVSVGIGVSYVLNERFALESGVNYSYLRSKWKTNGLYHKTTTQKLHFIGIPLSLSYKIAEWQKIRFYAAAGAMAEVNVAGKVTTDSYVDQSKLSDESNNVRMNEWYWSVNARVGASYPLWRYLSLYAEVGASYYFDNDSNIETVHSEKPFNVDLQAGLRFNF